MAQLRGRQRSVDKDANFRIKFGLPENERVIDDFSCAISKEVLLHGRLYVSARYMCFYSNIFGHKTMEVMPFARTLSIEKRNTSLFIPNAVEITVQRDDGTAARHFFTSFKDRDAAIATLKKLWGEHKAGGQPPPSPVAIPTPKSKADLKPEPEPEPEPSAKLPASHPVAIGAAAEEMPVEDEIDIMLVADENQEKVEMAELVSFTLTECSSCVNFFEEFFADSSDFTMHYREQRGDTATELTPWQQSTSLGQTRTVRFISPVKAALGPKTTKAEETQRYQLSASGNSLLVQAEAIFPSVPYGECFKVVTQYAVSRVRGAPVDSVKIVISSGLRWLKSTWWESLIKDGTRKENTESFQLWQRLVMTRWTERLRDGVEGSPRDAGGGGPPTVSSMLIASHNEVTGDESTESIDGGVKDGGAESQPQSQQKAPLPYRPTGTAAKSVDNFSAPVASERILQEDKPSTASGVDSISSSGGGSSSSGSISGDKRGAVLELLQSQWLVMTLAGVILILLFVVKQQMDQITALGVALDASRTAAAAPSETAGPGVDLDKGLPCPAECAARPSD